MSGAQCHALVGPKIPIVGVPSAAATCSRPESFETAPFAAAVPNARVPDLQPLDQVARMIARASFVVGVDTGLLHLAAALSVPLVAIFTGTEPGQHGPLGGGKIEVVGALGELPSVEDVSAAVQRITP